MSSMAETHKKGHQVPDEIRCSAEREAQCGRKRGCGTQGPYSDPECAHFLAHWDEYNRNDNAKY